MDFTKTLSAAVVLAVSSLVVTACLHDDATGHDGPSQADFDALKQTVEDLSATVSDQADRIATLEANAGPVKLRSVSGSDSTLPELSCIRLSHGPAHDTEIAAHSITCQHPDTGYLATFSPTTADSFQATPITGDGHSTADQVYFDQSGCGGNAHVGRATVSTGHGAKHGVMFKWRETGPAPTYWYVPAGSTKETITSLSYRDPAGDCFSENQSRIVYPVQPNDKAVTGFESGKYAGPNTIE